MVSFGLKSRDFGSKSQQQEQQYGSKERAVIVLNQSRTCTVQSLADIVATQGPKLTLTDFYLWMRQSIAALCMFQWFGIRDVPIRPDCIAYSTELGVIKFLQSKTHIGTARPNKHHQQGTNANANVNARVPGPCGVAQQQEDETAAVYAWGWTFSELLRRVLWSSANARRTEQEDEKRQIQAMYLNDLKNVGMHLLAKTEAEQMVLQFIQSTLINTLKFIPRERPSLMDIYEELMKIDIPMQSTWGYKKEEKATQRVSLGYHETCTNTDVDDIVITIQEKEQMLKQTADQRAQIEALQKEYTALQKQIKDLRTQQDTLKERLNEGVHASEQLKAVLSPQGSAVALPTPGLGPPTASGLLRLPYLLQPTNYMQTKEMKEYQPKRPTGLHNLGNTCFFNSYLQCLSATHRLLYELLISKAALNKSEQTLLDFLQQHKSSDKGVVSPRGMHDMLVRLNPGYKSFNQEDSLMALKRILDSLNSNSSLENCGQFQGTAIGKIFYYYVINQFTCPICTGYQRTPLSDSCCSLPLNVSPLSSTGAEKGTSTEEKYTATKCQLPNMELLDVLVPLKRPMPLDPRSLSVQGLLNQYFAPVFVDGYTCTFCSQTSKAPQEVFFMKPPHAIILNLMRYTIVKSRMAKDKRTVKTDLTLSLDQGIIIAKQDVSSEEWTTYQAMKRSDSALFLYDLYGVVSHMGSLESGHYIAYVKVGSDWYYTSDSSVSKTTEADVLKAEAFILFYERRTSEPLSCVK